MTKGFDVHSRKDVAASRARVRKREIALEQALRSVTALRVRRDRQLRALAKAKDPRAVFVAFLLARVGRHEDAGRPNRAGWLDRWARRIGEWMVGQPWCGLTIWMAADAAGVQLTKETVSTVAIREQAKAGKGGFKTWHPASAGPEVGWVAVYGTAATGPVHTGAYVGGGQMAEGNTSPGKGGSQNNGGGLYLRSLAERRSWVLGWAEIDWKAAHS